MPKVTVEVQGLKELEAQLVGLGDVVGAQKVLQSALTSASAPMLQAAKDKAPVAPGPYEKTLGKGNNRRRATFLPGFIRTTIRRRKLVEPGETAGVIITVGRLAWWAKFFEHGGPNNPKQPFMLPAFDEQAQPLLDSFSTLLQRRINAFIRKRNKQK